MMANIQEQLLNVLEELKSQELKKFQWCLTNSVEDYNCIPKAQLENADRHNTMDKMVEKYGPYGAVEITLVILKKMNHNQLAEVLRTKHTRGKSNISSRMKIKYKEKFKKLYEEDSLECDRVPLKDTYTEVYVIKGCTGGVNTQHEVRQVESFYPKTEETPVTFSDLFKVQSTENTCVTKVLTLGIAGVGKTVSVHKFILDWAEEKCNQDLDFILYLPFRELNLIKDEEYSLSELLHYFHSELHDGDEKEILSKKHRLLFILDGLDESRIPLNNHQKKVSNVNKKTTLEELITNLINGELLPSALLWITSRPAAVDKIKSKDFDPVTEIRGFNNLQKEEYFRKRIGDEAQASRIISHIKTVRSLHILCHIPVFCRITATVLQNMLKDGADITNAPTTLTEMYLRFLLFLTEQMTEKYHDGTVSSETKRAEVLDIVKLTKLAFLQLQKGQLLFYESDLKECGIDVHEALVYSGICTQIFKKEGKIFSFVHLSFQEFLAAVFVFLTFKVEGNPLLTTSLEKMKWKVKHRLGDLLNTAVDKAMKSENGHLDLFLRFLFGLSLESNKKLLKNLHPELDINQESVKETVNYIKKIIKRTKSFEKTINLFHCLSELKDNSLTTEIQNFLNSGDLSTQKLSPTQSSALVFVLLMSEEIQEKFELKKYRPSDKGLRELLFVVKNTRRALLSGCGLTEEACKSLASILQTENSLRELEINNNDLQDSGGKELFAVLKSSHCKLEILNLAHCSLSVETCIMFSSALQTADCSLRELDLSNNDLQDSGMKRLSATLKGSRCKLQILRLAECSLTAQNCEMLSSALQTPNCHLRELDLSNNNFHDSGVEHLSVALKGSQCKLEIFRLVHCSLTAETCKKLSSALQTPSCPLRELDLSNNDLQDLGVEHLSVALKGSQCNLEILRMSICRLTEEACKSLTSVLQTENSSLRNLEINNNDLQDSGVEQLCAGLKSSHCKLEILRLSGCLVTEEGCSSLASALSSNPSHLKELDLTYNHPGESGVKLLSARLEDSHCRLDTLRVEHSGKIRIRPGLRKYACVLTLDPNTAHTDICLSDGNRKVTLVWEPQSIPDHPERFDVFSQVMSRESLSGRCYWEVEWSGEGADIAVTYKGISRKGDSGDCLFGFNVKSWSLNCSNNSYTVCHNIEKIELPAVPSSSNRVGVYLDWTAGTLSFYSVSSDTHTHTHLHTLHSTFTEPLYAGFRVWDYMFSVCVCELE